MVKLSDCKSLEKHISDLEAMLDLAPDLIFRVDRQLRHVFVNQRVLDATGLTREQYIGKTNRELQMPEKLCQLWDKTFSAVFGNGSPQELEFTFPSSKGLIYYQMRIVPEKDLNGNVTTVIGITRDITKRKEAEQRLSYRERLYRSIAQNFPDGAVYIFDRDLRFIVAEGQALEFIGYSREELEGKTIYDLDEETQKLLEKRYNRVLAGETLQFETEYRGRFFLSTYKPVFNELGRVEEGFVIAHDITEHKVAEEALRKSQEELHNKLNEIEAIYRSAPIGMCVFDRDLRFVRVNDMLAELNGIPAEEHLGKAPREIVPALADFVEKLAEKIFRTGEPEYDVEVSGTTASRPGVERHFMEQWLPILDTAGNIIGINVVADEITEYKQLEIERERRIAALNDLVQTGTAVLASDSMQEMLDNVVDAARSLTGAKIGTSGHGYREGRFLVGATSRAEDSPPCPPGSVFEVEKGGVYLDLIERAESICLTNEELMAHPLWWGLPKDHSPLQGLLGARLSGKDGEAKGLIMVSNKKRGNFTKEDELLLTQLSSIASLGLQHLEARESLEKANEELDIRVQERTEQLNRYAAQLEWRNRELQEFASVASHDLQEPLRKIQAFGDMLQRELHQNTSDLGRNYLNRMRSAANRMQTLIKSLLAYSRVSTKTQPFNQVDLKELAEDAALVIHTPEGQTKPMIQIGSLPKIDADAIQITQLLQNLIINAVRYSKNSRAPIVKISGRKATSKESKKLYCEVRVEDNGIGFDMKYLDRIFQPFERLHGRSEYEGTGMGLAICRKIVERHGGTITAESQPGKGSTFIVTLPVRQKYEKRRSTD